MEFSFLRYDTHFVATTHIRHSHWATTTAGDTGDLKSESHFGGTKPGRGRCQSNRGKCTVGSARHSTSHGFQRVLARRNGFLTRSLDSLPALVMPMWMKRDLPGIYRVGKVLEGTAQAKTQRGGTLWHCSTFLIQKLPLSVLFPPTLTEGKGSRSTEVSLTTQAPRGQWHGNGLHH